jgi:hypothetical protein
MDDRVLVAVDIPLAGDERHKNWAKVVESVDTSRSTGWAYDGPFINPGGIQDVPVGAVVLVYGERGSRANPQVEARVYTVNPDSTITLEGEARGKAWARTLRDTVSRCLDGNPPLVDLSFLSDEALAAELAERGWKVEKP